MFEVCRKSAVSGKIVALVVLAAVWIAPANLYARKKDKKKAEEAKPAAVPARTAPGVMPAPNVADIVFPPPPAVKRLEYLDFFSAQLPDLKGPDQKEKKKASWMDRMAGVSAQRTKSGRKPVFQLLEPYGLAVDSKGQLYVADTKVGAIFIFNTENNTVRLIKNGVDAHFKSIFGLAMDDNDTLLCSDGGAHHVLVFDSKNKLLTSFGDGEMKDPNGIAIDTENRFVYVVDTGLDQVLVYDADSYKLLRRIGTTGKNHTLTDPGDFSKPTNVAVDADGNLYVSDTLNDRIEVFDADGNFIRTWGKNGDGPGDFARPKGIGVDSDGHIWVVDAMLNRLQVFTPEGYLLLAMGGFGITPAHFAAPAGLTIDRKRHRIFTSEQLLGRVQMFRYYTNEEARAELAKRQQKLKNAAEEREKKKAEASAPAPASETPGNAPVRNGMKLPDLPLRNGMKLPDLPPGVQNAPAK
jgi:DNA-binding beta-propeller fold protein YncE